MLPLFAQGAMTDILNLSNKIYEAKLNHKCNISHENYHSQN